MDLSTLVPGARVRARLRVKTPQLAWGADHGKLKLERLLSDSGFRDVRIYLAPDELPADWPASDREPADFPEWIAWAEGTWTGPPAVLNPDLLELELRHIFAAPQEGPSPPPPGPGPGPAEAKKPNVAGVAAILGLGFLLWLAARDD